MRFVIVTGVSGAGKTAALKMLEDARYRQQCMLKTNLDSVIEIEDLQEKLRKVNLQVIKLQSEKQELLAMNKELQRKIEVMKLQ